MKEEFIFHIADKNEWKESKEKGEYIHASLSLEGFIHCSKKTQLIQVSNTFFKGNKNLLLLKIEAKKIESRLEYDFVEEMKEYFPHIYGPLNLNAVVQEITFSPLENGEFALPSELQG